MIIWSKNPVKINSVKWGFDKMLSWEFLFTWISVESWVTDQPMTNEDTLLWAKNRAENAKSITPEADFRVWIEWWSEIIWNDMQAFAWIVILSKHCDIIWKSRTSTFFLPKQIADLIKEWKELWEADDIVFGQVNSKQNSWAVGILTWDCIDRTKYYQEAVILWLIPFKNIDLYT